MHRFLKLIQIKILRLIRVFPAKLTDTEDVRSLIKRLRPLSTDKKLIRFGPKGDGGYLLPEDLIGIDACFSPGVADLAGFEKDCTDWA